MRGPWLTALSTPMASPASPPARSPAPWPIRRPMRLPSSIGLEGPRRGRGARRVPGAGALKLFHRRSPLQDALLDAVSKAVAWLVEQSQGLRPLLLVGAPLRYRNRLYNCALAIQGGKLLGVVPKLYPAELPRILRTPPFRRRRHHFERDHRDRRPASAVRTRSPVRRRRMFPASIVHAEICEDIWVPMPPSVVGGAGGRDGAGQSVGQQHHHRQGRDAPAAVRSRNRRAAWPPMSTPPRAPANPPPISPGTARP